MVFLVDLLLFAPIEGLAFVIRSWNENGEINLVSNNTHTNKQKTKCGIRTNHRRSVKCSEKNCYQPKQFHVFSVN